MIQPLELTVMMYHYVRDPGDEAEQGSGIPGLSVRTFEAQLDALAHQHTIVTWFDVRQAIEGKNPLPNSACLLTFDDGIRDHYINVFKILHNRNLSGLFFVLDRFNGCELTLAHKIHFLLAKLGLSALRDALWEKLNPPLRRQFLQAEIHYHVKYPSNTIDDRMNLLKTVLQRDLSAEVNPLLSDLFEIHIGSESETAQNYYLNLDQIREMHASGMYFGGHSHNHPWFDWIDPRSQSNEIKASAKWLKRFETGPWAFAYPFGGFSSDSPDLLKSHGFVAAFTTKAQLYHPDQYLIGRLDGEEMIKGGGLMHA